MADQRMEKWTSWINGRIKDHVLTMQLQRAVWEEATKIIAANGQLPDSYWWEFMRSTYATTQAVAVRRQADTHRDVASLGKLIEQVRDDAARVTRDFWIGLSNDPEAWSAQYAGETGTHIDPSIPAADFDALTRAAANVKDYVDEHLAHADAVPTTVTLDIKDVHEATDVIGGLFRTYYLLFTAHDMPLVTPVISPKWKLVFTVPWWMRSPQS
jgi:hypothetical protein